MKPEQKARDQIDLLLEAAGWQVQDIEQLNLGASRGIAVREFPLRSGPADWLLRNHIIKSKVCKSKIPIVY
ncbi:MAG TPA: hypothetical protein VFJ51_00070 [Nitrososphaeraceae archaeon]|nr:hypothetical protein [Nitrososphaeraceae archaeon]